MFKNLILMGSLLSAAMLLSWPSTPDAQKTEPDSPASRLVFAGSGSNLAITRALASGFMRMHPKVLIEVPPSIGSRGGIMAAVENAISMGLVSRPLKEEENKLGLTVLPFARTAVVIGAHPSVSQEDVTFDALIRIYRGETTHWNDGHEIIVLTREPGDSSIESLSQRIPGFREAYAESRKARRWMVLFTDQEMDRSLEETHYSIGITSLGSIMTERRGILPLKLNGVSPTLESIRSGQYPVTKDLSFVFLEHTLPETAQTFIEYVRSAEGTNILSTNGYVSLK